MVTPTHVLAFDPGVSTGIALLRVPPSDPVTLEALWQISGGIQALLDWLDENWVSAQFFQKFLVANLEIERSQIATVSEKFTPLQGRGFSQTLDSTLPLVGEGLLIARRVVPPYKPKDPHWQRPNQMYSNFGGSTLPEKKKRARAGLKELGLYKLPKELGTPDSDDAMSATLHALYYVTHMLHHKPTFNAIADIVVG